MLDIRLVYFHVMPCLPATALLVTYYPSPSIGGLHDTDKLRCEARQLRLETVINHSDFISGSAYFGSSGKGYIGLNMPRATTVMGFILSGLRNYQANRIQRLLTAGKRDG